MKAVRVVSRAGRVLLPVIAALGLIAGSPVALAQFSKSYQFLDAVRSKDAQKVTDAIEQPGSTIINTRDITTGETALHIVTKRRDLTWLKFLLAKGADANLRDSHGVTPLVVACNLGFVEAMEVLIASGAQVDIPSDTGETPLIAAVHRHDTAMMRVLLQAGANPDRSDSAGRSARDYARQESPDGQLLSVIDANAKKRGGSSNGSTYGPKLY